MHCPTQHSYSITSSARNSINSGIVEPIDLAALRLIVSNAANLLRAQRLYLRKRCAPVA